MVDGAERRFGDRRALAGVSLRVEMGELYALLGPNGAGKTTLIRAIIGHVRLDRGRIDLGGFAPGSPQAAARLGLVPQEIALYPELTAAENLELIGQLQGLDRTEAIARTHQALRWIDLAERAQVPLSTLSGGMRRRVNIAAGLLHQPRLLLLDEPTVGVDPQARVKIHEMLVELKRQGMAILLTTHDLHQAAELADRIGIMDQGRIVAEGTESELIERAFGQARRRLVRLNSAADATVAELLRTAGLTPRGADLATWDGRSEQGFDALESLRRQLLAKGVEPREIAQIRPDLSDLFFELTGKELRE